MPFHSSVLINFKLYYQNSLNYSAQSWSDKHNQTSLNLILIALARAQAPEAFPFFFFHGFPPSQPLMLGLGAASQLGGPRTKRTRARRAHPSSNTIVGFQGVRLLSSFKEILLLLSVLLFPLKNSNSALTHNSLTRFSGLWKEGAQKTLYYVSPACPRKVSYVVHLDTRK